MPLVKANGIEIEYDALGDPANPPMLLIMGLGAQLITWDDGFCEALADRHFHVIRYDNRDAGLSTKMDDRGPADVAAAYRGEAKPAYSLDDLADDAAGLLDALRIDKAHIVGASSVLTTACTTRPVSDGSWSRSLPRRAGRHGWAI